jgi:hypothetical protein
VRNLQLRGVGDLPAIKAVGVIHQRRVAGFAHFGEDLRDRLLQPPVNLDLHGEQCGELWFEIGRAGIEQPDERSGHGFSLSRVAGTGR